MALCGVAQADDKDTSARKKTIAGAVLLALSAGAAIGATATGALGATEGVCMSDSGSCASASHDRNIDAAIGLGVIAVVTAAIGVPLLVAGHNATPKRTLTFGVTPTTNGAAGALAVHF